MKIGIAEKIISVESLFTSLFKGRNLPDFGLLKSAR